MGQKKDTAAPVEDKIVLHPVLLQKNSRSQHLPHLLRQLGKGVAAFVFFPIPYVVVLGSETGRSMAEVGACLFGVYLCSSKMG